MTFAFQPAPLWTQGALFLGRNDAGQTVGIETDRHAIGIGGARSGKGAGLIIPNLLRWRESAVVIDPKGEAAEATAKRRAYHFTREGQDHKIGIVDPLRTANVPDELRVAINPLADIDPASIGAQADIKAIADGLVKRSDPRHAEWDNGAVSIIAGVSEFVVKDAPPNRRNLVEVRRLLAQTKDDLYSDAQLMLDAGALAKEAGIKIMSALETADKTMERDFLNAARRHTAWIDEPPFTAALSSSDFSLADLKTKGATLYLVLPPEEGAFLRLFVCAAMNAMRKGLKGKRCLFLLDEFFALGKLDTVAQAAGHLPGYGVHLFPFLQDLGQLQELYGVRGAETFFGSADAHIFFGNADMLTLKYVSERIGPLTPAEVAPPFEPLPPVERRRVMSWAESMAKGKRGADGYTAISNPDKKYEHWPVRYTATSDPDPKYGHTITESNDEIARRWAAEDAEKERAQMHADALRKAEYEHAMRKVGTPRITPQEVAALTGKNTGDLVARSAIVFGKLGQVHNIQIAPWWIDDSDHASRKTQATKPRMTDQELQAWWRDANRPQSSG